MEGAILDVSATCNEDVVSGVGPSSQGTMRVKEKLMGIGRTIC